MSEKQAMHPPIEWAQRKDVIFLTIAIDDCKIETLDVQDDKLVFKGTGSAEHHLYEGTIEFFDEVNGKDCRRIPADRNIQLVIPKKKKEKEDHFWPRLMKQKGKVHWIKIDFSKWKDEDDSDGEKESGFDLNSMMGQMGGGGMGDFDDKPDLDDFEDSDNEDLPDLEDDTPEQEDAEKKEEAMTEKTEEEVQEKEPAESEQKAGDEEKE